MAIDVKKAGADGRRGASRSRVSSKHQITIPLRAFAEAGLREGTSYGCRRRGGDVSWSRVWTISWTSTQAA